jgi:hypothetical protein
MSLDNVAEIIDEGFANSSTEQLVKLFGNTGEKAIYFRPTDLPEIMLASVDPITDEVYAAWKKSLEDTFDDEDEDDDDDDEDDEDEEE